MKGGVNEGNWLLNSNYIIKHRPEASCVIKPNVELLGVMLTNVPARIQNNVTDSISYLTHSYNLLLILEDNALCFE